MPMSAAIEAIAPTKAEMIDAILAQYPRLDRGMAELAIDVHRLMEEEHGSDYDPAAFFSSEKQDASPSGEHGSGEEH